MALYFHYKIEAKGHFDPMCPTTKRFDKTKRKTMGDTGFIYGFWCSKMRSNTGVKAAKVAEPLAVDVKT
jgi:hypothetical protein